MSEETFFVSKPWKFACETCGKETTKKGRNFLVLPFCKPCVSATARIASQKGREKPRTKEEFLKERNVQHLERKEFFENYGFQLLSSETEYQGVFSPLRVICKGGHETSVKWNNFLSEAPKGKGNCMQCLKEKKRKPWDEIVAKFREKNCEILLEQKDYKGNKQDVFYKCHCGRKDYVRLGNMGEKWIGCPKCSKKRERVPWSIIKETIEVDGCVLDTKEEDYRNNTQKLYVLCGCCKDKTYEIYFPVSLKEFRKGKRCPDCLKERRETVFMELYGVKNPSQHRPFMEKAEETRLQKFGVRHVMQRKDFVEKAQRTNMEKYGLKYAFMSQETHEKIVETMLEKYGKKCFLGTDKFKAELVKRYGDDCFTRTKEYKAIMMEKFGQEYYVHCEKFKKAMMEKYGVEHAMHHPESFAKMQSSCYRVKEFTSKTGKKFLYQGYEAFCLSDLLEREGYADADIATRNIPVVPYFFEGKRMFYYPDIYIEKENKLIEVKSHYTMERELEKNFKKMKASKKAGFNFEFRVYDEKGRLLEKYIT
uniref:Zinc ribbon containing protein n=1 Tax=Marseillevirus sp. TaxID=2809551 RepID=A0AA96ELP9_9VIRU|nr:zinc ribbon containing protein [Marseillevirus sp.]